MNPDVAHNACHDPEEKEDTETPQLEDRALFLPPISAEGKYVLENVRCSKEVYRQVAAWSKDALIDQYLFVAQLLLENTMEARIPHLAHDVALLNGNPAYLHCMTRSAVADLSVRLRASLSQLDAELVRRGPMGI